MQQRRAKAFAIIGAIGLLVITSIHLLLSRLELAPLGAAWIGFYIPWAVFLLIGALGHKLSSKEQP